MFFAIFEMRANAQWRHQEQNESGLYYAQKMVKKLEQAPPIRALAMPLTNSSTSFNVSQPFQPMNKQAAAAGGEVPRVFPSSFDG
jgi:hypothetical protein